MNDYCDQEYLKEVDGSPVVSVIKDVLVIAGVVVAGSYCYMALLSAILDYAGRY